MHHFVETRNGRVGRHAAGDAAAQRNGEQQANGIFIQIQLLCHHAGGLFRQRMLAQQGGGDERQTQASALVNRFEGQVFADLGHHNGVGQGFARG
ncbi:hypothetical protein D3C71_1794010 [compost metagenome]